MIARESVRVAVRFSLVTLSSYLCGVSFTGAFHSASARTGGLWAVMSGVVVLEQTRRETWSSAWRQVLGTLVGSIVSFAYLSALPFTAAGMAASIFVAVLLCHALRIPGHARLAALAVGVVMVVSSLHPTLHPRRNAVLRFSEACIGTTMAALAVLVWPEASGRSDPAGPPTR
jgi:uncharacterized membrane protein YccC